MSFLFFEGEIVEDFFEGAVVEELEDELQSNNIVELLSPLLDLNNFF